MARASMTFAVLLWSAAGAATPVDLRWLEGNWFACKDGEPVEERWAGPVADTLIGLNLSASGGRASYEFLRISRDADGSWGYHAMPRGASAPTRFALKEAAPGRVTFENTAHDFPQRIAYRRDGDRLVARIEGRLGKREVSDEWSFVRAHADATCRGSERERLP